MEKKRKLVYVASFINFSFGMEWMVENLDKNKYDVDFIFLNPQIPEIYHRLKLKNIQVSFLKYRGKRDLLKVILQLFVYFKRKKTAIVHAHLFDASFAAITAAWFAGVTKRIHTRHHATIHHDSHPHAIKYDRFINTLSTRVVAVSENVKDILINKENVEASKVSVVHHGFDFSIIKVNEEQIIAMRKKYRLDGHYPVVGVISRFVEWKGIQYIIPAFKQLLARFPDAKLILANAKGDYEKEIVALLDSIPSKNYVKIEFEPEIYSLMKCFDALVHVPIDKKVEAFGQIYVEAMSCSIPVICTLSGVANSYIQDHKNALVVPFCDSESIHVALLELFNNPGMKVTLLNYAYKDVIERFAIQRMIADLEKVYE